MTDDLKPVQRAHVLALEDAIEAIRAVDREDLPDGLPIKDYRLMLARAAALIQAERMRLFALRDRRETKRAYVAAASRTY